MVDPDLSEAVLPPQFKGNLRIDNANALVAAVKQAIIENKSTTKQQNYEFYRSSGVYGKDADWALLLKQTSINFDILGVTLRGWRDMNDSRERFLSKAGEGCHIRVLTMSPENTLLDGLLLANNKPIKAIRFEIEESYRYYTELSKNNSKIEVRQIKRGIPHFFLTRTDQFALLIQYTSSLDWGNGPAWRCKANTDLYDLAVKEFEHLWEAGTNVTIR